jgi:hypothetical protein
LNSRKRANPREAQKKNFASPQPSRTRRLKNCAPDGSIVAPGFS